MFFGRDHLAESRQLRVLGGVGELHDPAALLLAAALTCTRAPTTATPANGPFGHLVVEEAIEVGEGTSTATRATDKAYPLTAAARAAARSVRPRAFGSSRPKWP